MRVQALPSLCLGIALTSPAVAQTVRLREAAVLAAIRGHARGITVVRLCLVPRSASDIRSPDATLGGVE